MHLIFSVAAAAVLHSYLLGSEAKVLGDRVNREDFRELSVVDVAEEQKNVKLEVLLATRVKDLLFIHEDSLFRAVERNMRGNKLMLGDIDDEIIDVEEFVLAVNLRLVRASRFVRRGSSLGWVLQVYPSLLLCFDLVLEHFVRDEHNLSHERGVLAFFRATKDILNVHACAYILNLLGNRVFVLRVAAHEHDDVREDKSGRILFEESLLLIFDRLVVALECLHVELALTVEDVEQLVDIQVLCEEIIVVQLMREGRELHALRGSLETLHVLLTDSHQILAVNILQQTVRVVNIAYSRTQTK